MNFIMWARTLITNWASTLESLWRVTRFTLQRWLVPTSGGCWNCFCTRWEARLRLLPTPTWATQRLWIFKTAWYWLLLLFWCLCWWADGSLEPTAKTIIHIPNVNSRESTKDKIKEVEHILAELGEWEGADPLTGFQLIRTPNGKILKIADLVDDDQGKRDKVSAALKDPNQKDNRDHVDIIIALGMAKEGFDWIWYERHYASDIGKPDWGCSD